ncbi:MAG: aspartate/glutamate racemase family protein, partial [Candidatus Shapirobacteria bacterium]
MMKLLVIRPVIKTPQLDRLAGELDGEELAHLCKTSAAIEVAYLPEGPASIECEYDEIAAGPAICRMVLDRTRNVDGILIDCFVDPAIDAARELSPYVPILGAGGASLAYAAQLG